uniref:RNase H type-1 domain-containing protein n=1 Tax=Cajanus cajan TaxID=3821 RepID=A0A151UB78_CAJCA|nr:hypothetical protein KK1_020780 [Cajanus cajan]
MATQHYHAWKYAQRKYNSISAPTISFSWVKPLTGSYMCNLDAAIFTNLGTFGFGLCIRDSYGSYMAAKTG